MKRSQIKAIKAKQLKNIWNNLSDYERRPLFKDGNDNPFPDHIEDDWRDIPIKQRNELESKYNSYGIQEAFYDNQ